MKLKPSLITSLSPPGRCNAALLCHPCPCTVSVLTQAFHFHASLFITGPTIPAIVVQGKNGSLSFCLALPCSFSPITIIWLFLHACVCLISVTHTYITNLNNERTSEQTALSP